MIVETLRVFVTTAEQRNFSRAAELLNLSQPGVSLHIRNLENEFGTKLMIRSPKLVKLTEAGEILYKRAKEILALYEAAKQDIYRLHDRVTGSLHIGGSFTIGEYILPRLLASFAEQYPQVEMDLTIGNTEAIIQSIRESKLDLGLVEGEVTATDLIVTPYMRDEMILVAAAGHPLSSLKLIKQDALHHQVWVLREGGSGTRAFVDQFMEQAALDVKRSYVFNSSQGVKEAVSAGLGIAIVSRLIVQRELEAGEIVEIPIEGVRLERSFSLIRTKEQVPTMSVQMFLEKLLTKG
ncbi:LysR family transcriptional regulator [Paenibacillus cellulosilyticus]|uniref:LysR family transcriptional regulator n=1 Tax=Paenibacillus cellulosilyticus TaxID=375489 RepID=A0A2V2Z9E8_9BACL|nr:LysR family transcriptional regulator [Paenibacillus cellulosilyticus]PWW08741.1 LysR family transcriptional regulator [Paenibacillus cellulosilyticus]QKS48302.1 LysR family transcriptional regulator [Paenibacillus cellulosilyticus]